MKPQYRFLAGCALLAATAVTTAQAGGVPPPRSEDPRYGKAVGEEISKVGNATTAGGIVSDSHALLTAGAANRQAGAIRDFAGTTRGALRDLNLQSSDRALVQGMGEARQIQKISGRLDRAGTIATGFGYAATAADAAEQAYNGDVAGAVATVGQAATDDLVQRGGGAVAYGACAGGGGPVGGNVCKGLFNAGYAVGTAVREIDTCRWRDCGPGRSYTIQDGVTDAYYGAYEKVKFAAYPELDPMSPEFEAKAMAEARARQAENRRRYESRATDLESQQRELDAERMEAMRADAAASANAAQAADTGFLDFLNTTMALTLQQQQLQSLMTPAPSPVAAPSSGACHPGHDESAHPGGCHDGPMR